MIARALVPLACAALLFMPARAEACSCVGGVPLCQSLWTTDAVFTGDVVDVTEIPEKPGSAFMRKRVTFRVLEVWRGTVAATTDVTTGSGGGDCGYSFVKGGRYLVYAHANASGALSTSICSRTRLLSAASEDIAYLKLVRSQPAVAGRIYGTAQYQRDPDAPEVPGAPIPGYTVELTGGGTTRTTTTRADGTYEFGGVAAGDYVVSLKVPAAEDAGQPYKTTLADPRGCAAQNFYVVPDGRIRVRLLDDSGRPVPNLRIDLLNLDGGTPERPAWQYTNVHTGADGRVELARLRPRRYLLAVNAQYPPKSTSPYATSYFPGVPTRDEARPIALGVGERVDLGDWVLRRQDPAGVPRSREAFSTVRVMCRRAAARRLPPWLAHPGSIRSTVAWRCAPMPSWSASPGSSSSAGDRSGWETTSATSAGAVRR